MANYDKKRVVILIKTIDGREYKYVKPTVTVNGTLVGDYYEYSADTALVDTQAFTDFGALKTLVTNAVTWIVFNIDTTNNTLNYYNSEEKETTVARPRRIISIQKLAVSSVDIEEFAYRSTN